MSACSHPRHPAGRYRLRYIATAKHTKKAKKSVTEIYSVIAGHSAMTEQIQLLHITLNDFFYSFVFDSDTFLPITKWATMVNMALIINSV